MVYKNLKISNFRGIKHLELSDFSRINVLLGRNSSGKSSILEAIFLLSGSSTPNLTLNVDLFRNLRHDSANDFTFLFNKLDYENKPEFSADLFKNNGNKKFLINPKSKSKKEINISEPKQILSATSEDSSYKINSDSIDTLELKTELKFKNAKTIFSTSEISFQLEKNTGAATFQFKNDDKIKEDFIALFDGTFDLNSNDLYNRLDKVIIDKRKDEVINGLKIIDNKIIDISLGKGNMIYVDLGKEFSKLVPINLLGDGAKKITKIILNLNTVKNGVLLIDEIDNGLHFSVLEEVWKIIIQLSIQFDVQVFVTTHSKETLESLNSVYKKMVENKDKKLISCYTISKNNKDQITSFRYDADSLADSIQQNMEIRGEY
jgi:AAA15 family ATPase/GTPase